jgi:hypothetical protein
MIPEKAIEIHKINAACVTPLRESTVCSEMSDRIELMN